LFRQSPRWLKMASGGSGRGAASGPLAGTGSAVATVEGPVG